jgi:hypothetical protein
MKAIFFSETSVDSQRTIRRYIPEDDTLQNYRCKNFKSYKNAVNYYENKLNTVTLLSPSGTRKKH